MRIIYEDGNYREERERNEAAQKKEEFVDISSMSDEYKKSITQEAQRPYRPASSLRPEAAREQTPAQPQTAAAQPQTYAAQPQPYAPQQMYYPYPQGYPVQYPQYPQGYPYPAGYPAAGQPMVPVAPTAPVAPYPPQPQPIPMEAAAQTPPSGVPDSGTRVIYQSPDFDSKEPVTYAPVSYTAVPVVLRTASFTQEEVVVPTATREKALSSAGRFDVDEMEMSVFEINSMAHKYQAKARAFRNPGAFRGSLDVHELGKSIEEEELVEELTYEPEADDSFEEELSEEKAEKTEKAEKPGKKSKKKKKKKDTARKTVLAISILAIIISSGYLVNEWRMSDQNEQEAEDAQQLIIDDIIEPAPDEPSGDEEPSDEGNDNAGEDEPQVQQMTVEEKWAEIRKEYPKVDFPSELQLKYAKLYATNKDFVGYLSAEGVGMDLPIVQGDDDETYLKKSFFGKNTKYGCPFVTHINKIPVDKYGLDMNTVIFGHHMKDGSVFGVLDEYKSIEGFKAAPVITFNTLYNDYQWKIIGVFLTNAYEKDDNGYVFKYYFTNLSSEERFSAYLNAVNERTLYYTGVDVLPTDKILTLSTCSYEFTDARFVVVARLVRHGESAEVDVSKAYENENPRYPQAYYDKKKKDNPYKDAYRWEVG